jgi:hypothetical protein
MVGVEATELYVTTAKGESGVQVALGRKRADWNQLDRQWQLGIWEPRFRWDLLNPDSVGLSGLFVTYERPGFQLTAMGSPGFIPERGAPMELRGDQWVSYSPLARTPPPVINVLGSPARVGYELQVPSYADLLLQPGGSLRARFGRNQGFWSAAGYAYKPMNQAILAFDGIFRLGPNAVEVDLHPRAVYHHVLSGEAGYETRELSLTLSTLFEIPVDTAQPLTRTVQQLAPSQAYSATAQMKPWDLTASVLVQSGGNAADVGQDADGQSTSFETRYPYQLAASVSKLWRLSPQLTANSRGIFDFSNDGMMLSAQLSYRFDRSWMASLGGDLLISGAPLTGPGSVDLISLYRGNDRIQAGVSYVF